jgi:hypothetical protein
MEMELEVTSNEIRELTDAEINAVEGANTAALCLLGGIAIGVTAGFIYAVVKYT